MRSKSSAASLLAVERGRKRDCSCSSPSLGKSRLIVRSIIRRSKDPVAVCVDRDDGRLSLFCLAEHFKRAQLILGEGIRINGDKTLGVSNPVLDNGGEIIALYIPQLAELVLLRQMLFLSISLLASALSLIITVAFVAGLRFWWFPNEHKKWRCHDVVGQPLQSSPNGWNYASTLKV